MSTTRKRAEARKLREQGLSIGQIAREMGHAKSTVHGWLKAAEPERPLPAPPAANQRAATHRATSELALAPLRQDFAIEVRERWPWLDDIRLAIVSDRLARLELARTWLDDQHALGLDRDGRGEPFPIVDRVEKWGARTEQIVAELEREARERASAPADLDAYLAETYGDAADTPADAEEAT